MKLKDHARLRMFFEPDCEFPENLAPLVARYNVAAKRAAGAAKWASSQGGAVNIVTAQWWEGVTQTLEECIRAMTLTVTEEDGNELPEPPKPLELGND